jgi:hypothetical protein
MDYLSATRVRRRVSERDPGNTLWHAPNRLESCPAILELDYSRHDNCDTVFTEAPTVGYLSLFPGGEGDGEQIAPLSTKKREKEMKVKLIEKEVTEWVKTISLEREGVIYEINLRWDIHNGYDIVGFWQNFKTIPIPEWARVPEFEYDLDCITEDEIANV